MKIFNEQMLLKFGEPTWERDPEMALIDTILDTCPELYDIVKDDVMKLSKHSKMGRQDIPTVEQIVRAAIYKELKGLDYRELEYAEYDSKICGEFIRLEGREPFSFQVLQKYISNISAESLRKLMIAINTIAMQEGMEDGKRICTDSTAIKTNIHYPTNNSLIWDSIKELNRLFKKLKKIDDLPSGLNLRNTKKQAKKNYFKINVTKSEDKRKALFISQLKILAKDIKRGKQAAQSLPEEFACVQELKTITKTIKKVYDMSYRHELLGEKVPNSDKIFSIYEQHTDIIVKGSRDITFGHKVNFATGKSNLILDCFIADENPKDTKLYQGTMSRITENYDVQVRDSATDGGYASLANSEFAKGLGITNIVFNKLVGSLQNIATSQNMETRLKKWRSTIEAVISNIKRGFNLRLCEWKSKEHFDSKVFWSVIAYNIRVMANLILKRLELLPQ